ncbi:preprotein translocase subunit SecA [Planctomycetes bacterium Pan216]|uniref:Protein translocase subunit SecA n=2 Tax=Kolteria novifilia TaxID=2527975 RepID=A0A518B5P5_9BACT|nr:preprotein translocase subunit SecA [Planctomycetes bacterium Pan216]
MDWQALLDRVVDGCGAAMEGVNRGLIALFGNSNEREIRKLQTRIEAINALESQMTELSDSELKEQTQKFRRRFAEGESLDELLVEAFAACRESGRRFMGMRHYDVQLVGGMVLHSGRIAEMVTGEGKTLVATLPAYLNSISGMGVHCVTVNDYLARRDAEWMSPLYNGLGLEVGAIQSDMAPHERRAQYAADITYGTNNEFGFDYLRDNMKPTREMQAQGTLNFAIIDEVDSILIDEARTPLIISGPAIDDPQKYAKANRVALSLKRDSHFEVNEKEHTCHLTDQGILEAERQVGVESFYTAGNMEWPHLIDNALKAHNLYRRDKEYVVQNGAIVIVDEHTGRKMEGRQWSDGLHQAVEAKEGVKIKEETQTLATITFQNFFKLYNKIAGMTGTAMTEANEFYKIYKLDVVAIPTNRELCRLNHPDVIYCTQKEKWKAVVEETRHVHGTGRPILIGTTSVEKSEFLSELFRRNGIKHEVLNAKYVEREADIVAQAGRRGAVTIATNMAGRGTDIILGGNAEAMAWSELKSEYPTRLEVPPDVWEAAVAPMAGPMKKEGEELKQTIPTLELAKAAKVPEPEKLATIVDEASDREREDPSRLASKHHIKDIESLQKVIEAKEAATPGGLHIIGTERHESRRIDNQLRGRSGRQGDPGSSRFFLSLEDDLMRIFAGDWVRAILQRMGMQEGEAIESAMVSRRIAGAQRKVEERNFEARKNLLEYDEIMDHQRKRVYTFRQDILDGANCKELALEMINHRIDEAVERYLDPKLGAEGFAAWAGARLGTEFDAREFERTEFEDAERTAKDLSRHQAESTIIDKVDENLDLDVEEKEWNWEALANWANSVWNLKLKPYDLRRAGRDDASQIIFDHAEKSIDSVNLEAGRQFFEEDFGITNLCVWTKQKFGIDVTVEELTSSDDLPEPERVASLLKLRAGEVYADKEIVFPVHCGMARFMADKATNAESRYDREGLINWAKSRFRAELDAEEFRNLPRQKIQERLIEASRAFFRDGAFHEEIERRLAEAYSDGLDVEVPAGSLGHLSTWSESQFGKPLELHTTLVKADDVRAQLLDAAENRYRPEIREMERVLLLQFLDTGWKDHLYAMDHLKAGIGLVGYAQVDPKVEYKRRGRMLFEEMWNTYEDKVTDLVFRLEEADSGFVANVWNITNAQHASTGGLPEQAPETDIQKQQNAAIESSQDQGKPEPIRNRGKRVGRNDPCPCGSGKKYKNCCMGGGRQGQVA